MEATNKIIAIGYRGDRQCYLNVSEEEAIKRYCDYNNISEEEFEDNDVTTYTIEFTDEFGCYDIWE